MQGAHENYGAKTVLDSIDLTIEPWRIVGLFGLNGSGKTTLIKLANGLLDADVGRNLIAGKAPAAQRRLSSRTCLTETRCPAG